MLPTLPSSAAGARAPASAVTADAMRAFKVADVRDWAAVSIGLDAEDADILVKQKIDGEALFKVTEEKLMKDGMPRGPAGKLADAVAAIISAPLISELKGRQAITHHS